MSRSGGGRGGYTFSGDNQNANTVGRWTMLHGEETIRRNRGGLGGRPLDY